METVKNNNSNVGATVLIAPSLLSCDFANLEAEIKKVTEAGADWLHVDVMDGHFVKNITIGPPVVKSIKRVSTLPLDVHLMIENPENYIDAFMDAGSDILTIHVESTRDPKSVLEKINKRIKSGITLRPSTPLEKILPYLELVDLVLVMTVEPGFGGQEFMETQVEKIRELQKLKEAKNLNYHIEIDGGINDKTAAICKNAGANVFVAGSYVFKNDYKKSIDSLRKA